MKAFTIHPNDAGQRLDRFVRKVAPTLPPALLQRYIRVKRVKLNGRRAQNGELLRPGDLVELYVNDEFFPLGDASSLPFLTARGELDIVYEDDDLLLVDKRPGLVVHEDDAGEQDTLIARVQRRLYERGQYDPARENSFVPALCNRIDRNTGGIVIAAKNAATLRVVNELIRDRLVKKHYLCLVQGTPHPPEGKLRHHLLKDERTKRVEVFERPVPGAKTAVTQYRTVASDGRRSLLEIELHTGRTHQIRAQLAHIGHPLLGDAKYGRARDSRGSGLKHQALYAHRLMFDAGERAEHLAHLNGRLFEVPRVWFADDFLAGRLK